MKNFVKMLSVGLVALTACFAVVACGCGTTYTPEPARHTVTISNPGGMTITLRRNSSTGDTVATGASVNVGTVLHVSWTLTEQTGNANTAHVVVTGRDNPLTSAGTVTISQNTTFAGVLTPNTVAADLVTFRTVGGVGDPFEPVTDVKFDNGKHIVTLPSNDRTLGVVDLGAFFKENPGMRGEDFSFKGRVNNGTPVENGIMLERIEGAADPADYLWRPVGTEQTPATRDTFGSFVMFWYADEAAGALRDEVHLYLNTPADITHENTRHVLVTMTGDNDKVYKLEIEFKREAVEDNDEDGL